MSTATTLTAPTFVGVLPTTGGPILDKRCAACGHDGTLTTTVCKRRIQELEDQVRSLNMQAQVTASKLAEYEEEVRHLRSYVDSSQTAVYPRPLSQRSAEKSPPPDTDPQSQDSQSQYHYHSRLHTLISFLPSRRPSGTPSSPPLLSPRPGTSPQDALVLKDALCREQRLRRAAESQLSQANLELEELTAQLFSQANGMVAQERKARAKLEERITVLERRDMEKGLRLEKLERAMDRLERLRKLVG